MQTVLRDGDDWRLKALKRYAAGLSTEDRDFFLMRKSGVYLKIGGCKKRLRISILDAYLAFIEQDDVVVLSIKLSMVNHVSRYRIKPDQKEEEYGCGV